MYLERWKEKKSQPNNNSKLNNQFDKGQPEEDVWDFQGGILAMNLGTEFPENMHYFMIFCDYYNPLLTQFRTKYSANNNTKFLTATSNVFLRKWRV